ncbi:MAG: putative transrane anti-sigma factor [Bryobacterales bacterium]|nr:putative transrane anti-sigma factor [Bryobacterales bacterium]
MICLGKNQQGADLLTGYLAKTLDAARTAELNQHVQECADCRSLIAVWERLDEFAAPEITPGFDARLYARIAADEMRPSWWRRLLWRPVAPLAAAAAVVAVLALFLRVPGTPDASKQASNVEIEQVAQAVDDLDLLIPIGSDR